MESELDIIDSLNALGYKGPCLEVDFLKSAIAGGTKDSNFRTVVCWLTTELHALRKTDEKVSPECEDPSEFAMELSAMLKELCCPFTHFITGPLSGRFESRQSRLQLMDYLSTELMATKMQMHLKPQEQAYVIRKTATDTAMALEQLTKDLALGKPPDNVAPKAFFNKLNFKLEEQIRNINSDVLSGPLMHLTKPLSDDQWKKLEDIHADLDAEYNLRRQVLLTRLEVTIQSFQWSDRMSQRQNEIIDRYQKKLKDLEKYKYGGADTDIVALLAARADLAIIEKTSSASVRKNTASKIQKHVIGSVPDRGGRAHEHAPPPPEMPSWQQQRATGPPTSNRGGGQGRGGGQNRGGGGGYWSNQPQPQREQNWSQGSGRVQGAGWVQGNSNYNQGQGNYGSGKPNYGGGRPDYGGDRDNFASGNNYGQQQRGGGGYHNDNRGQNYRGRSNYNRGGGGGYQRR